MPPKASELNDCRPPSAIWDSGAGNNENGNSSTANFVAGMMKTVPPLDDLFNMAGLNLPTCLNGAI